LRRAIALRGLGILGKRLSDRDAWVGEPEMHRLVLGMVGARQEKRGENIEGEHAVWLRVHDLLRLHRLFEARTVTLPGFWRGGGGGKGKRVFSNMAMPPSITPRRVPSLDHSGFTLRTFFSSVAMELCLTLCS